MTLANQPHAQTAPGEHSIVVAEMLTVVMGLNRLEIAIQ